MPHVNSRGHIRTCGAHAHYPCGALPVRRDDRLPGLPARAIGNPRGRRLNELAVCRLFDSGQFEIQVGNCLACAYDLAANGDLAAAGTRFGAVSFPIAG